MTPSSISSMEDILPLQEHRLSVENRSSFFQDQYQEFLLASRTGRNTDLKFISKSGVVVSAHQAILLPRSSFLQTLLGASEPCGCSQEAPSLLLPDEDHTVVEALVDLLYSGSSVVTGGVKDGLVRIMRELCFDFLDELLTVPLLPTSDQDYQDSDQMTLVSQVSESDPPTQILPRNEDNGTGEKTKIIKLKNEDNLEITGEQESLIKKLSYVLKLLQRGKITNDQFFIQVSKPVGDLLSCLKYLPGEPHFGTFPPEIKRNVLSYLCDFGTIVAAVVCSEWRDILNDRLILLKKVQIGKHCSNLYACEEVKCFMPEQMLVALNILQLNPGLEICSSVTNVDPKVFVNGLTRVSKFWINNTCDCARNDPWTAGWGTAKHLTNKQTNDCTENEQILTQNQTELLIETLERKSETVNHVGLFSVDMAHLDQENLMDCLLKIKTLHLSVDEGQMDVGKLIEKLAESSVESKLKNLSLYYLEYPENLSVPLADALFQVPVVILQESFPLTLTSTRRLIKNIRTQPCRIKCLVIVRPTDWRTLVNPDNLKIVFSKMTNILLRGRFTPDQMEAVRSLPGVDVDDGEGIISKRVNPSDFNI